MEHAEHGAALTLTRHHGHQAGFVDVGEGAELSDSQDGFHVGVATRLPKLTDLVIHGCEGEQETLSIHNPNNK